MDKVSTAGDSLRWAISETNQAGLAFFGLNIVGYEFLTNTGLAALLLDMRLILVSEIFDGAQYWIGSGSAESAERDSCHHLRDFLKELYIPFLPFPDADIIQNIEHFP